MGNKLESQHLNAAGRGQSQEIQTAKNPEEMLPLADYGKEVQVQAGGRFPSQMDTLFLNCEYSLQGSTVTAVRSQTRPLRPCPTHAVSTSKAGRGPREGPGLPTRSCPQSEMDRARKRKEQEAETSLHVGETERQRLHQSGVAFERLWNKTDSEQHTTKTRKSVSDPGALGPSEQRTEILVYLRLLSSQHLPGATEEHSYVDGTPKFKARRKSWKNQKL